MAPRAPLAARVAITCFATLLLAGRAEAFCPPADTLDLVGRYFTGGAREVEVDGDDAYFASGAYLIRADVSDPTRPRIRHRLKFPSYIRNVTLHDGRLYLSLHDAVHIVHPGPDGLIELGRTMIDHEPAKILVRNGTAYVVANRFGLYLVDVRDPHRPRTIGSYQLDGQAVFCPPTATDVAIAGNYAYLGATDELRVLDLSIPSHPTVVHRIPDIGWSVELSDGYLYLSGRSTSAVDISRPDRPVEVSRVDVHGDYLKVRQGLVFVAGGDDFSIIDFRAVTTPKIITQRAVGTYIADFSLGGDHVYLALRSEGMRVFELAASMDLVEKGRLDIEEMVSDVHVIDNVAFAATRLTGLLILDVSDPAEPLRIGRFEDLYATALRYSEGVLYVKEHQVYTVDISNPRAPEVMAAIGDEGTSASEFFVADGIAYIAGRGGLRLFDVRDPREPRKISEVLRCHQYQSCAGGMDVVDGVAYLVDYDGTFWSVDARDPENPHVLGELQLPDSSYVVAVVGSSAYVAARTELYVVDVSDPAQPVLTATRREHSFYPSSIRTFGDGVYLFDEENGLATLDAASNSTDDHVYIAGGASGLYIFGEGTPGRGIHVPLANPAGPLEAYPNPFDHDIRVNFPLFEDASVRIVVYDVLGRAVAVLSDRARNHGEHSIRWDGTDAAGAAVPPGLYFVRVEADGSQQTMPIVRGSTQTR